jgi:hypothetical protein
MTGEIGGSNIDQNDQTNIRLDKSVREVFDVLVEHRNRKEPDTHAAIAAAEACAKQAYPTCSIIFLMQTDSALLKDDALTMCEERDRRFEVLYKCMPTDHIHEYLNTIHGLTVKDHKILLMTLQTFEVMLKDIHSWKVRQAESKVVNRVAGYQLPCDREMGYTEALQDFLDRIKLYFIVKNVTEGGQLSTMSNRVPHKSLRKLVVRFVNSNLT